MYVRGAGGLWKCTNSTNGKNNTRIGACNKYKIYSLFHSGIYREGKTFIALTRNIPQANFFFTAVKCIFNMLKIKQNIFFIWADEKS